MSTGFNWIHRCKIINNEIVVNSCTNTGMQGFLLTVEIVSIKVITLKRR